METIAILSLAGCSIALLALLLLHFLSPEFSPQWRMISEYAMGKHKWALTAFFLCWGLSTILFSFFLWKATSGPWAGIGVILYLVSGVGGVLGGVYDVNHKLHGLAFFLGVPTMPIGAMLISYNLAARPEWNAHAGQLIYAAHATWITFVLMFISMALMMSGFKKAGIVMGPGAPPPKEVPPGTIAVNGYFNRVLVLAYVGWTMVVAGGYLQMQ